MADRVVMENPNKLSIDSPSDDDKEYQQVFSFDNTDREMIDKKSMEQEISKHSKSAKMSPVRLEDRMSVYTYKNAKDVMHPRENTFKTERKSDWDSKSIYLGILM